MLQILAGPGSEDFEVELFFESVVDGEYDERIDYETMVLDGSDEDHDTDEDEEALQAAKKEQAGGEEKVVEV